MYILIFVKFSAALIDEACLLFSNNTCRIYDTKKYALYLMAILMGSKALALVSSLVACYFSTKLGSRPGEEEEKGEEKGEEKEEEKEEN
jgi:hypothetical protein